MQCAVVSGDWVAPIILCILYQLYHRVLRMSHHAPPAQVQEYWDGRMFIVQLSLHRNNSQLRDSQSLVVTHVCPNVNISDIHHTTAVLQ